MNTSNIIEFPTARSERTGTRIGAAPGKILRSKDSRRNGGGATSSASVASSVRETLLASEIWDALNDGRIELHYQPQYNMQTGMTVTAEASAGCPFAQGFGFAKPMAIDAFRTFLTDHPTSPSSVGLRA